MALQSNFKHSLVVEDAALLVLEAMEGDNAEPCLDSRGTRWSYT